MIVRRRLASRSDRNELAYEHRRAGRLAVWRAARRLDRHRIGRRFDDAAVVSGKAGRARPLADHPERARRAEARVDDPQLIVLAGRRFARRPDAPCNSCRSRSTVTSNAGEAASFCRIATYSSRRRAAASSRARRSRPRAAPRGTTRRSLPTRQRATLRRKAASCSDPATARPATRVTASRMRASIAGRWLARRLDRRRGLRERREALFPGADRCVEVGLAQPPRGESRALAGSERAEREFGGGEIVVGRDGHDARQSLNCARLRCSQVLIVGTGRPKRLASASRLAP